MQKTLKWPITPSLSHLPSHPTLINNSKSTVLLACSYSYYFAHGRAVKYREDYVCLSVCLSVGHTGEPRKKMSEPIEGGQTRVGPRNHRITRECQNEIKWAVSAAMWLFRILSKLFRIHLWQNFFSVSAMGRDLNPAPAYVTVGGYTDRYRRVHVESILERRSTSCPWTGWSMRCRRWLTGSP